MSEISIVVGLGNPGPQYRSTRHNLGFMALDRLAGRHALSWKRGVGPAQRAVWRVSHREITLFKPLVFMNESGSAVERLSVMEHGELLVVCDDLNLPLGQLRLRKRGGSGSHKGLDSVIEHLGTEEFPRLRMGIGSAPPGTDWVEFVLSEFESAERERVDRMVDSAADAIEAALREGLDVAMTRFNRGSGEGAEPDSPRR